MDYLVDTMNVYTSQEDNLNLTHAFQNERDSYSPLLWWPTNEEAKGQDTQRNSTAQGAPRAIRFKKRGQKKKFYNYFWAEP